MHLDTDNSQVGLRENHKRHFLDLESSLKADHRSSVWSNVATGPSPSGSIKDIDHDGSMNRTIKDNH